MYACRIPPRRIRAGPAFEGVVVEGDAETVRVACVFEIIFVATHAGALLSEMHGWALRSEVLLGLRQVGMDGWRWKRKARRVVMRWGELEGV